MNINAPIEHTLKVDKRRGIFKPSVIRVRDQGPYTEMLLGTSILQFRTKECWELAWKLQLAADDCTQQKYGVLWAGDDANDFVVLSINGEEIHLGAIEARNLAKALWRRSDAVDDFQLKHKVRIVS